MVIVQLLPLVPFIPNITESNVITYTNTHDDCIYLAKLSILELSQIKLGLRFHLFHLLNLWYALKKILIYLIPCVWLTALLLHEVELVCSGLGDTRTSIIVSFALFRLARSLIVLTLFTPVTIPKLVNCCYSIFGQFSLKVWKAISKLILQQAIT